LSFDTNPFSDISARHPVSTNVDKPSLLGHWDLLGQMQQVGAGGFLKQKCGGGVQQESLPNSVLHQRHQTAGVKLLPRSNGDL